MSESPYDSWLESGSEDLAELRRLERAIEFRRVQAAAEQRRLYNGETPNSPLLSADVRQLLKGMQ